MNDTQNVNKSNNAPLVITLVICLIVLAILVLCVVEKFSQKPDEPVIGDGPEAQYIELAISKGMRLNEVKVILDELEISYEVIPTASKRPNLVENIEYVGKAENGKLFIEIGSAVKLHANEVSADKIMYLTFDDGPTRDNTLPILDMLEEYGIAATFFVEGQDVTRFPDRIAQTVAKGHLVGCHSYSHDIDDLIYSSTGVFIDEIEQYEDAMIAAIGEEAFAKMPKVLRFPGGTNNYQLSDEEAVEYIAAVRGAGYMIYDWTALTNDADNAYRQKGESDLDYFMRSLKSSIESAKENELPLIVLMHDKKAMRDCLADVLEYLVGEGYYFDTIDSCPEYTFVER